MSRDLYASVPGFPQGALVLESFQVPAAARGTMLGLAGDLAWTPRDGGLVIAAPPRPPEGLPCQYAYAFKIEAGAVAS